MTILYTCYDGSVLKTMSAKELISFPVWKGNRILDSAHAEAIQTAIGSAIQRLDTGYKLIKYDEQATDGKMVTQTYLIDGQHRAHVLRSYFMKYMCEPDFNVVVTERHVNTETDAIEYFNELNHVKPQEWKTDPNLIANRYIEALSKEFNPSRKLVLIRPGNAYRPYLSADKLREVLVSNISNLKNTGTDIKLFVYRVVEENAMLLRQFQVELALGTTQKDSKLKERAVTIGFGLAIDTSLKWVETCLVRPVAAS